MFLSSRIRSPTDSPKATHSAFVLNPASTWFLVPREDATHLLHGCDKPLLQLRSEGNLLLAAACKNHDSVRRALAIDLFYKQALGCHLEDMRIA